MTNHTNIGLEGEKIASEFLLKKGCQILERNYRFQKAEIDIIAKKDEVLIVVEVKTRSTKLFGNPQEFLKPKQIQRIVKATDHYVTSNKLDVEVRFDIIAIVKSGNQFDIEHFENAYYHF